MKRDQRLIEWSREHHAALKLARRLRLACGSGEALAAAGESVRALHAELERHFDEEEVTLLPILRACAADLAERLMREHIELRALLDRAGEPAALERLGTLLEAHVRFEEREMFPRLEAYWRAQDDALRHDENLCRDVSMRSRGRVRAGRGPLDAR